MTAEKTLTIIPVLKYPLNILEVRLKTGRYLTCKLEKTQVNGKKAFKVIVKTKKEAAGNFYDQLIMKTDSKIKPNILVWVKARLKNKPNTLPIKK